MKRFITQQSISLTAPNEAWLNAQVESEKYTSKSEVVNGLIRKAREVEYIQNKLIHAEQGGFSNLTPDEMLAKARSALDGAEFVSREEQARKRLKRSQTALEQVDAGKVVDGEKVMEWVASWGTETERKFPR